VCCLNLNVNVESRASTSKAKARGIIDDNAPAAAPSTSTCTDTTAHHTVEVEVEVEGSALYSMIYDIRRQPEAHRMKAAGEGTGDEGLIEAYWIFTSYYELRGRGRRGGEVRCMCMRSA